MGGDFIDFQLSNTTRAESAGMEMESSVARVRKTGERVTSPKVRAAASRPRYASSAVARRMYPSSSDCFIRPFLTCVWKWRNTKLSARTGSGVQAAHTDTAGVAASAKAASRSGNHVAVSMKPQHGRKSCPNERLFRSAASAYLRKSAGPPTLNESSVT